MYGVPENLDLTNFIGKTLIQIPLGEFDIQFRFQPEGWISVEGRWELVSSDGAVVDHSMNNADRPAYQIHRLLGQEVMAFTVDAPRLFALKFANGLVLRVFDDSTQYESFSIHPGNIYV